MNLHLFNPDHDLALAHGTNHYMSPSSAVRFSEDVAALPAWLLDEGFVLTPKLPDATFQELCSVLGHNAHFVQPKDLTELDIQNVQPWGWNDNITKWLKKNGLHESVLPTGEMLSTIRELSHRRMSMRWAEFVRKRFLLPGRLPDTAVELTNMEAAENYALERGQVVFKMPWSGSGRGLRRVFEQMDDHQYGWVRRSIQRYGCIMAEPYQQVTQDFAMEFFCDDAGTHFIGYSLFRTHNGIYQENILLSDEQILQRLGKHVNTKFIEEIRQLATEFLTQEIQPHYIGCVGMDMFLYHIDNEYFINPFVEINLRTTMGYVATRIVQAHLLPLCEGTMRMRYLPGKGALLHEHQQLMTECPLQIKDRKIIQGYLALNPIDESTQYAVQVNVK